uniref:Uncharacterized protein n=1 Tax=mine drainage metagenome TaxID=410659 RepID=E6QW21_9ZZZZ
MRHPPTSRLHLDWLMRYSLPRKERFPHSMSMRIDYFCPATFDQESGLQGNSLHSDSLRQCWP